MRQKLGQHFLTNTEVPEIITGGLQLASGDAVIEIGPGHGELTQALIAKVKTENLENVKIIAIEKDPELAAEVRERFKEHSFFEVIEADILEFLEGPSAKKLIADGYKLTGNIPYYLTGHLLRIVSELEIQPALTILMIQKEVAERIAAQPPHMNRLAAAVQFWADPKLLVEVGKEHFNPPPLVDSAVILLEAKKDMPAEKDSYYAMVRRLFAQPRKTILNNIAEKGPEGKINALATLKELSISPDSRPQDLSIQEIAELSKKNFLKQS